MSVAGFSIAMKTYPIGATLSVVVPLLLIVLACGWGSLFVVPIFFAALARHVWWDA
jgi:hypothetical protein